MIWWFAFAAALAAAAPNADEKVRVTTRLVQVAVVAEDNSGRFVRDLKPEDFTLTDKGRTEKLAFFGLDSAERDRGAPPAGPGAYTNRFPQLSSASAGLTAVLFDGLNTGITDQAYARRQIVKFLKELPAREPVIVYLMGRGPRLLQNVGGSPAALAAALEQHKVELNRSLDSSLYDPALTPERHFDAWLGELTFNLVDYFDRDRAFRTVRALTAIARHLERMPGRKNLIWISGSFPVSVAGGSIPLPARAARGGTGWPETDRLMRALSRGNIAIYPVDARGLIAPDEYDASKSAPTASSRTRDFQTFAVMRSLAERTGGRAFYQNNDLAGAMERASADVRRTYLLGFYPSHDEWNGQFRELKVEVNRPDVRLHYRRGYFALPDEPREAWYREDTVEAAMFSPLDATGIGLTVRVTPGAGGVLDLDLGVDSRDLAFEPKDGAWHAAVDVWLVQVDTKEKHLKTDARTTRIRLQPHEYQRVMQLRGLRIAEQVKPSAKALLIRVMLRDVSSGALGTVIIPTRPYLGGGQ